MATEVLHPQDCLRYPSSSPSSSSYDVYNRRSSVSGGRYARPGRKQAPVRSEQKRRSPEPKKVEGRPVMGKVTILRRGESLPEKLGGDRKSPDLGAARVSPAGDLVLFGTGRIGPDPEAVPVYSGSAICQSPDPSHLPLPSFPTKKPGLVRMVDDAATKDLRRLLRLQ